ncbi:MAG: enoyl-CoA hydratase/isomerase family protein [Saprospiraceae bacterium]|nr:enoyl-CoA hydratase/isomerase family protein [Saprospiraceae bacterium]
MIQTSIQEGVALITIQRPEALNAINRDVMDGLGAFFREHQYDPSLKGVIITGSGQKAFAAGADIKEFASLTEEEGAALSKKGQDVYFLIERFHVPVIAAVNGFALGGGCELAMACHMRIAGARAKFGQPEVNLGLIPGYGGTQRLAQYIGKSKAIELLLTADMIDANEAHRLGLVNHVVEEGKEVETAMGIIQKIGAKGPIAVKYILQCVNDQYNGEKDGYASEYSLFGKCLVTDDAREGAAAFVEKRKAEFKGK